MRSTHSGGIGVVAIGRNEGERDCDGASSPSARSARSIVYVDSGSQDGSVAMARDLGVEVVELDLSTPFTAARARNEGLARLRRDPPGHELVQFVDGDCELVRGWIQAAADDRPTPPTSPSSAERRGAHRDATIYNLLCDLEWDTPVGEAEACGGETRSARGGARARRRVRRER
jgi:glycosyltransferase involved in cell wall biosynthesis